MARPLDLEQSDEQRSTLVYQFSRFLCSLGALLRCRHVARPPDAEVHDNGGWAPLAQVFDDLAKEAKRANDLRDSA
jgi:hypothetical protein